MQLKVAAPATQTHTRHGRKAAFNGLRSDHGWGQAMSRQITLMRWVDFWIGVPLCFCLSVIGKLRALLTPSTRAKAAPVKNVLFIELSEMGSAILAYSALTKVPQLFPGANVFFLIFDQNKDSVHLLGLLPRENVLTIRSDSSLSFLRDTLAVVAKMRRLRIDTVIDMELFSRATSIISALSGAQRTVGFYRFRNEGLYRGASMTHKVTYNPHLHISINFLNLVHALESPADQTPMLKRYLCEKAVVPTIASTDEEKARAFAILRERNPHIKESSRVVLLNPNAGQLPLRAWPMENYKELTRRLIRQEDVFIAVIGVKDAASDAQALCSLSAERCIDVTGRTTLKGLIDLFNIAHVLVTNDSGPAHFASLTPIRNIVLFGPETPHLYGPLGDNSRSFFASFGCSPCLSAYNHRNTPCTDALCLKAISIDDVCREVEQGIRVNDPS